MISLEAVSKGYAGRLLLSNVDLRLSAGERVGMVGPNGAGKSTLLALLHGGEEPDTGAIARTRGLTVGHLPQEILATPDATVLETALRPSGVLAALEAEIGRATVALEAARGEAEEPHLAGRLAELVARRDDLGGHDREARALRVLAGLGFAPGAEHRPLRSFSGGYVMRAELARLLTDLPDLLLLDEPTNHLDLESVLWLQDFLARSAATLVAISHDRAFLSAVATSIVEVEGGAVRRYAGDYDAFVRQRALDREQREARAREQERRVRETERFIERFRYKASKARQVQSRIKALEREERITVKRDAASVRIRFPQPPRTSDVVLELSGAAKSYGAHTVYRSLDFTLRRGEKTVLVGPNGAGKSTLLKLLGGAIELDVGERRVGHNVSVGYYAQHRAEMLDPDRTVLDNALARARGQSETTVRTLLGTFLFPGDDVKKKAAVLSGGEKSRLALALILLDPPSVLLMDEPTIHLDVPSVDALIAAFVAFEGALCFVSHDVHFIQSVARRVVRVENGVVTDFPGDWDYYCWRRAQPVAGGAPAGSSGDRARVDRSPEGAEETPERSGRGLRLERRRAAEARAAIARRLRPLRAEAERLEGEMAEIAREKAGLAADLSDPRTYAEAAGADLAALHRRHAELERRQSSAEQRWLEVQAEIEAVESPDGEAEEAAS